MPYTGPEVYEERVRIFVGPHSASALVASLGSSSKSQFALHSEARPRIEECDSSRGLRLSRVCERDEPLADQLQLSEKVDVWLAMISFLTFLAAFA